ncbi:MAG: Fic family protein [Terracidiphilus sp.]|jgi:cell filamentation protein
MSSSARDPYVYPGTSVLRNLKDLRDQTALNRFEADAVAVELIDLKQNPITGPFDIRRMQETHRRIFSRIYPWAGEFRKDIGMLAKNRSGFVVAYGPSQNIPGALASVFAALRAEINLKGLDADAMAKRLAYYYGELDAIHAFRDGNSRTLRVFTTDLAVAAGHQLDWAWAAQMEEDRERLYHARDLAVMRGDLSDLAAIIRATLGG